MEASLSGRKGPSRSHQETILSFIASLKACAKNKDLHEGRRLHADIRTNGLLEKSPYLGSSLVNMYAKCGALSKAQEVLDELPLQSVVSWSALIAGYAHHGQGQGAISCYEQMQRKGFSPNAVTYTSILKACGISRDGHKGKQIHDEIVSQKLLDKHAMLGNALVDMYAKCGLMAKAQEVFESLPTRDIVSWNALIAGYTQQGQGKDALNYYEQLQSECYSPNAFTFACALKACGITREAGRGKQIHDEIIKHELFENSFVLGTALVDMYAKCSMLKKAQEVFDELPCRDVVSWSALIAGYAQQGQGKEALDCYQVMESHGIVPNVITYASVLKACTITKDIDTGSKIYNEIVSQRLLESDVVIGNALVDMYSKCGLVGKAQEVFNKLHIQDIFSWSALIAGYVQQGQGKKALDCYEKMRSQGLSPNAITYMCILKACGILKEGNMGEKIYDEIVRQGLLKNNVMLGNAVVDMYAKCGMLTKAQEVFNKLPVRDIVSWNSLIAGYAQQGRVEEVLNCYEQMHSNNIFPDTITYGCILKACSITRKVDRGREIHDKIMNQGLLLEDLLLATALIDMYCKCGVLTRAQEVFEELPVRNVISWSSLIAGYAQQGQGEEALNCYEQMRSEGIAPNAITYACILKACSIIRDGNKGKRVHDEIVRHCLLEKNIVLGTALVDMYAKCGVLLKAQEVFDGLDGRNLVTWNVLIAGYVEQGMGEEAFSCYQHMRSNNIFPDAITYASILKACGIIGDASRSKNIHDEIVSQGLLDKSFPVGNALVDMYAKCGVMSKAQEVFDELASWDVISWSALIAGYVQQGQGEEALRSYERMQSKGAASNAITYTCVLKACAITGEVDKGKQIHDEIVNYGLLQKSIMLGTALVNMYAKCGMLTKAQDVFDELPIRNLVSWNALITGYAQQGRGEEALNCFRQMQQEGLSSDIISWNALIGGFAQQGRAHEALGCFHDMQCEGTSPDTITFVYVLSACSHLGLLEEGQMYYEIMSRKYGIMPEKQHHTCMVDLYSRTGHFDKALTVLKRMPSSDYPPVWSALLGACGKWGNLSVGRPAFERAIKLDGCDAAIYGVMATIYADIGMEKD